MFREFLSHGLIEGFFFLIKGIQFQKQTNKVFAFLPLNSLWHSMRKSMTKWDLKVNFIESIFIKWDMYKKETN